MVTARGGLPMSATSQWRKRKRGPVQTAFTSDSVTVSVPAQRRKTCRSQFFLACRSPPSLAAQWVLAASQPAPLLQTIILVCLLDEGIKKASEPD